MDFVKIAEINDVKDGETKVLPVKGSSIALYNVNGKFFATANECPHKGGPLGEGSMEGNVVSCPWHGWKFDVTTGTSPVAPSVCVKTYKVMINGNDIMIEM